MTASAGRILMLVENPYPQDSRIRNEANLLVSAGYDVSVIALQTANQPWREDIHGVKIYRIPTVELFKKTPKNDTNLVGRIVLKAKSIVGYAFEYFYFTTACFSVSLLVLIRDGFDVIHAHNPPDTLFLVALPYKIIGKKFVFDHHDLSPELYMSRYSTGPGLLTRFLCYAEWCSLKMANATIATNESYRDIQIKRANCIPETVFVVRNGPAENMMTPGLPSLRLLGLGKKILIYIGSLNPQDGVDYLIRSLRILAHDLERTDFYCVIMGTGDSLEDLRQLVNELNLKEHVEIPGWVSEDDLKANLAAADICVDPDPSSPLNDVSTWIKIMEYMAFSKPIVTFDLKETRFSAQEAAIYVPPNDERMFAISVADLMDNPEKRRTMGEFGRKRVENDLQWSVVSRNLVSAYRYLLSQPS